MVSGVLIANGIWLSICTIWAILCFGQAARDRATGQGFQKPIGPNDAD
ncbi:MAG: hypothetical protein U0572_10680 [Phycisphaerales bacterium]